MCVYIQSESEGGREGERDTHTHTHIERERERERHVRRERERERERQREIHTHTYIERERERERERQRDTSNALPISSSSREGSFTSIKPFMPPIPPCPASSGRGPEFVDKEALLSARDAGGPGAVGGEAELKAKEFKGAPSMPARMRWRHQTSHHESALCTESSKTSITRAARHQSICIM